MYKVVVELDQGLEQAYQIFKPEETQTNRASLKVKKNSKNIQIIIKAHDHTALRSLLNSVTKLLMIYDQVKNGRKRKSARKKH